MRQVLRAGALGRPRGVGWGGRWERGLGWGTHVNPWLIHVSVWQKPLQYCKLISLQLIKTNEKKNPFSPRLPSHAVCHITLSSVPCLYSRFKGIFLMVCFSHVLAPKACLQRETSYHDLTIASINRLCTEP